MIDTKKSKVSKMFECTNIINLIGIQMYLYLYLSYCNIIPLIVYVNGIITHSSVKFKYHYIIMYYDIIINFLGILYINIYTNTKAKALIISLFVIITFLLKERYIKNKVINELIHVIFIHIPLAIGIILYINNNEYYIDNYNMNNQCIEYKKGVIHLWL